MNTSPSSIVVLATLLAFAASASDFTWMASPADAFWNATSPNWNSGEAWTDNASAPNNAIFPSDSSQKTISIPAGETRHVGNMTVDGDGYGFGGDGRIGLQGRMTFNKGCTINALIDAKKASGLDFSTSAAVFASGGYSTLDPGDGPTNIVGRMSVRGRLKLASGVTRLECPQNALGDNALLYVLGNYNRFNDNNGHLEVAGATLYASQNFYVEISQFAQVTVKDGGKVVMPNVEWLNGLYNPSRLTVANGAEFIVATLRICDAYASQVNLEEGGLMAVNFLGIRPNNTNQAKFRFNGGRLQSRDGRSAFLGSVNSTTPTDEDWNRAVKFAVGEGGAVFDTTNGRNLYWSRPLLSDAEHDGGLRKTGNEILVLTHTNAYNGITCVDAGAIQLRVDNALPPGTTVRLGRSDAYIDGWSFGSNAHATEQWMRRVEGLGELHACANMHVTNSIAPAVNGTLDFQNACDLRGDYEITGDAGGCGCIKVVAGQDISALTLRVTDISAFNGDAAVRTYKILDAPNGYTGEFVVGNLADPWYVKYAENAAYLFCKRGLVIAIR